MSEGIPFRTDRSARNCLDYPVLHANDIDLGPTSIHHTIGSGAYQISPGNHTHPGTIVFGWDGGGSIISVPQQLDIYLPFSGILTAYRILADRVGTATIELWKETFTNYPPTVDDLITGTYPISLNDSMKYQDITMTSWTKTLTAGDTIRANLSVCTAITRMTIILSYNKT